jgi:hypothetical protein
MRAAIVLMLLTVVPVIAFSTTNGRASLFRNSMTDFPKLGRLAAQMQSSLAASCTSSTSVRASHFVYAGRVRQSVVHQKANGASESALNLNMQDLEQIYQNIVTIFAILITLCFFNFWMALGVCGLRLIRTPACFCLMFSANLALFTTKCALLHEKVLNFATGSRDMQKICRLTEMSTSSKAVTNKDQFSLTLFEAECPPSKFHGNRQKHDLAPAGHADSLAQDLTWVATRFAQRALHIAFSSVTALTEHVPFAHGRGL